MVATVVVLLPIGAFVVCIVDVRDFDGIIRLRMGLHNQFGIVKLDRDANWAILGQVEAGFFENALSNGYEGSFMYFKYTSNCFRDTDRCNGDNRLSKSSLFFLACHVDFGRVHTRVGAGVRAIVLVAFELAVDLGDSGGPGLVEPPLTKS